MNAQEIIDEVELETKDAHLGINWVELRKKVEEDAKKNK